MGGALAAGGGGGGGGAGETLPVRCWQAVTAALSIILVKGDHTQQGQASNGGQNAGVHDDRAQHRQQQGNARTHRERTNQNHKVERNLVGFGGLERNKRRIDNSECNIRRIVLYVLRKQR